MAEVKVPRKSIRMDMTAMCDVAFLLLTFFILTTKFKPDEAIVVDTPTSVSEIKLPESDILIITIGDKGQVFFGVDAQPVRLETINSLDKKYNLNLTDEEKSEFSLMSSVGLPVGSLKQYLNLPPAERTKIKQPGIPVDSLDNQLRDWILYSRTANPKLRIAIKGDKAVKYSVTKKVISTLQEQNINKFNFITGMENMPDVSKL
ncbi:MAG: biopolymer transporter ExbD [Cytophagales bacterium]|nr:biopolymer transporter ExbD [Cytophagales bacterium]